MYSITTLSGGQQVLLGQKNDILESVHLSLMYASQHVAQSDHKKKEHNVGSYIVEKGDTMAPKKSIFCIEVNFPTVARSQKQFWIIKN